MNICHSKKSPLAKKSITVCQARDINSKRWGMSWHITGVTHYNVQLGLPDKGCATKDWLFIGRMEDLHLNSKTRSMFKTSWRGLGLQSYTKPPSGLEHIKYGYIKCSIPLLGLMCSNLSPRDLKG